MTNKLITYFSKFSALSPEEENAIVESMDMHCYKKGDVIVKEGQANANTFFVLEGLVRQYKLVNAEEVSLNFFTEAQWIIAWNTFAAGTPSGYFLACLEDTKVVMGNEEKAQSLFQKFPRFESISRMVMEAVFAEQQEAMATYLSHNPEQRYLNLLKSRPEIIQRVPQYQLASYLGVTPESLSRIRKRIAS